MPPGQSNFGAIRRSPMGRWGTVLEVELVVDQLLELVDRVRPGPRYTSYPPATEFTTAFTSGDAAAELERLVAERPAATLSLYAHVPFCPSLCWYCGCNVVISRDRAKGADYVELLTAELGLLAARVGEGRRVTEIALGGGSPNFLHPDELVRLFDAVRARFSVDERAEIAVELDPRETRAEQLAVLAGCGVGRISVGVQDFAPAVQAAIHREQSVEQTASLIERARAEGIARINADLVYGLPAQTPASFAATLDAIIAMAPNRLALFGYAHLPHLRPHQKLVERAGPVPGARLRAELVQMAFDKLERAGYVRIGLDHFALPDDDLARAAADGTLHRNFQGYTVRRADALVAVGTTGISDTGGAYWQNVSDVDAWAASVRAGELPVARGIRLDDDDRLRRHVITRLMCDGVLDLHSVDEQFGIRFADYFAAELDELGADEYADLVELDREAGSLLATPLGTHLIRNVCMVFDRYLAKPQAGALPRFSPTL